MPGVDARSAPRPIKKHGWIRLVAWALAPGAIVLCMIQADPLYWKVTYWLRHSQRVSALWHMADLRSTWNMPEIRHGLDSNQEMAVENAAVAAARLGRREGLETLVRLSTGDCLKISPGTALKELFGGLPVFEQPDRSVATWWEAVRDRVRFVPETGTWSVSDDNG